MPKAACLCTLSVPTIAKTVYGAIGIKVWVMHGEKIGKDVMSDNKREK